MFKIGQKVMCIDDRFNAETRPYMPCWVKKFGIYTIRGIHKDSDIEGYGVYLEEIVNPEQIWANDEPREWSFNSTRFRPRVDSLLKPATVVAARCPQDSEQ